MATIPTSILERDTDKSMYHKGRQYFGYAVGRKTYTYAVIPV